VGCVALAAGGRGGARAFCEGKFVRQHACMQPTVPYDVYVDSGWSPAICVAGA